MRSAAPGVGADMTEPPGSPPVRRAGSVGGVDDCGPRTRRPVAAAAGDISTPDDPVQTTARRCCRARDDAFAAVQGVQKGFRRPAQDATRKAVPSARGADGSWQAIRVRKTNVACSAWRLLLVRVLLWTVKVEAAVRTAGGACCRWW